MSLVKSDTPMMRQFNALKKENPDCILFFRAGDFYEMFGEDAVRASEILQIALTTRNKNSENAVAMCGVPYHAFEQYLNKLTAAGVKVAIAEQMEDPAQAKGLVRREVVRVVTPGTAISDNLIDPDRNVYLAALAPRLRGKPAGLALVDLSTGEFEAAEFDAEHPERMEEFLVRLSPRELLLPQGRNEEDESALDALEARLTERLGDAEQGPPAMERVPSAWFDPAASHKRLTGHFGTANLDGFGVTHLDCGLRAAGALLAYLEQTQKCDLTHITQIHAHRTERVMWLDEATLTNLEVFDNARPGGKRHTLFAVLNQTRTPMGARLLRHWLARPLLERDAINERLDAVAELAGAMVPLDQLREGLGAVHDLERIVARISLPGVGIADMLALRGALAAVQALPELLSPLRAPLTREIAESFDPMEDVYRYLADRFLEEPSLKLAAGGYIADGVIPELDGLRAISRDSKTIISRLEAQERERTGISSLKIRFNKVFGYYIEVSRAHQAKIPDDYQRKQTLVNHERFTTPGLEEIEEKILTAEERIGKLEYEEFQALRTVLGGYARRMQATARKIATVDVVAALAHAAREYRYSRPLLAEKDGPRRITIRAGRHPVIERIDFEEQFVPNDLVLDGDETQIVLLTGPNMAGKSTVMRQVALITLMAQMGSFVPADRAELCLVDRIFTRVGASDNLSRGQSTFMLEMNEAANILNNATSQSLIVLDEIGRGTSTYDGISIAWAMAEFIHRLGALTLFATHYHELTQLAMELPRLKNFNMAIREDGAELVFTRKLIPGEADKSYGVQVARLAGLPQQVVDRAHAVMDDLISGSEGTAVAVPQPPVRPDPVTASTGPAVRVRQQLSFLVEAHPVLEELRDLELDRTTPLEALNLLQALQGKLVKGGGS
ncbi:MAG: DNA mismatch repair protein MutS [SAR324 cluster bacterium]|nr:DNA mismatch repair protein MutS [SAR324 cluster bacterium]